MIRKLMTAVATAAVLFASTAVAQPYQGGYQDDQGGWASRLYGRADVGVGLGGTADVAANGRTAIGPVLGFAADDDLEVGWQAGYAIGIENFLAPNLRIEVEGIYTDNETDDDDDNFNDIFDTGNDDDDIDLASADVNIYGGLLNVAYDFDYEPLGGWRPFVGAGIGYGRMEVEYQGAQAEDEVTLWQLKAGAGYDFGNGRSIEVAYRYLNAESADINFDDRDQGGTVDFDFNGDVEVDKHALLVGYR